MCRERLSLNKGIPSQCWRNKLCHCSLKGSRSTSHTCQLKVEWRRHGKTYGAGWEPTSRSCGRSKESHNGQSLGDLHDGRECFRKLGTRLMAVDTWGTLVLLWEMKDLGNAVGGKEGQFEGFW